MIGDENDRLGAASVLMYEYYPVYDASLTRIFAYA